MIGCALAASITARAQLASRSPFLPPQAANAPSPTQGATLEFRGTMETPEGGLQVRIYDPAHKVGAWLKVNERDATLDALIKQYDDAHSSVTLEHEGKLITLAQHEAKIASSGMVQPMAPPMPQAALPNMLPAVTQSVVPNPTPQQEQARLEAVAAEVARRRALREQAQQQLNQTPQPQVQQGARPAIQLPGRIQQR
jgi:hypothetical protein